jgi:hypothetical protein
MALQGAKAITVLFDSVLDQMGEELQMAKTASVFKPDPAMLQNSNNVLWRPVEQQAPVKTGFDMTGLFGNVIELSYPAVLGTPENDAFSVNASDFRDPQFVKRRGQASAKRLFAAVNQKIATTVRDTGSLFYRKSLTAANGYSFIAEADSLMTERQCWRGDGTSFFLNARAYNLAGTDLAQRGTLSGRPEKAYATGMVGKDIAGFDVYKSGYNPSLVGGATPATTVATTVALKPLATQTAAGQTFPVDYRSGDITFASGAGWAVGDRITFPAVNALGLLDKTNTGQLMTFCIVAVNGAVMTVYPRPIAITDAALTADEKAYANISTQILSGAVPTRLNTDALIQTNSFWANDSVEIIAGSAAWDQMAALSGWKSLSETLDNGMQITMAYDGSIETMDLKVRVFNWYGVTNRDPSRNGVAVNI